jgi:2-polyprenyl-6-methoxyphenol hydroxylase-like FAD-dependent oxidoreductase
MPTNGMRGCRRVVIAGAGIAGLAAALRLHRSGWHVLVVERAAGLRGGGYLIGFLGVGYDAAERLGLMTDLERAQPDPVDLVYVDRNGRQRAVLPAAAQTALLGPRTLSLLRGDLETVLYNALSHDAAHDPLNDSALGESGHDSPRGAVEFRFATTIEAVDQDAQSVTVQLSDGRQERADLLIGADGVHSTVRTLMFGPEERFLLDFGHNVATYPLKQTPAAVPAATTMSMDLVGRSVGVYRLHQDRAAAFFAFQGRHPMADAVAVLRREFGDLGWVVPDLLRGLDAAESIYFDRICQIRMDRWSSGRVVLLGDAAWCVSLFAGYGASLAVGGAELLGDALDATPIDIPAALVAWERRLRPTVAHKQRQGRRARALFVTPTALHLHLRLLALRLSASKPVQWSMRRFLGLTSQGTAMRAASRPDTVH